MDQLVAAATSGDMELMDMGPVGADGEPKGCAAAAENGELPVGPATLPHGPSYAAVSDSKAAETASLQQQQGSEQGGSDGPQPILELPNGLPGQHQVGPKYKRGRGRSFFKEQPKKGAVCQVPGCDRSLHKLRDYYKRYKICPYHLELPCLVVEGQTIRFCQQCGRFQLLNDFEGDRRSCRRKLDKHNERRRKAEAEQKARMMDSGSDSPDGSARGTKAHRVSPYRGGGIGGSKGFMDGAALMLGLGGPGDLNDRLKALASDPSVREGIAPGLLQSLADPGMGGMDWLAAGSLTNLALGPGGGPPPPPLPPPPMPMPQSFTPVLPPELMALLPADVQQQVMQQGSGVLSSALLTQLQQVAQQGAPPPPPQPSFNFGNMLRSFNSSGPFSNGGPAPPSAPAPLPYGAPLPPGAASLLGPSLQEQLQLQPPQQHRSDLPPTSASVFMQQMQSPPQQMQPQQHQQQQPQQPQHHQQQQPQPSVPLLRSEPIGQLGTVLPAEPSEKAAFMVALAKSVGVSQQELAKAIMNGGLGGGVGDDIVAAAAAVVGRDGGARSAAPEQQQQQMQMQMQQQQQQQQSPLVRAQPGPSQHPQQQQQQASLANTGSLPHQQQASDSLGKGTSGASPQALAIENSRPDGSNAGAFSSPPSLSQPLQQQPGSVFKAPAALASAGSGALPSSMHPPTNGVAPGPLDMGQLQSAVQNSGLNPGFASDANLLLQLVQAVEAAQREAGPGKDRMHSLSLKLFNCTPDRLPKNILDQLESWMVQNRSLLDGASRPGCVQLSVSALMSGQEFAALSDSFSGMVQRLAHGGLGGLQTSILAQLDGRASLVDVREQQLLQVDLAGSGAVPQLCSVRPLAVTPHYSGPIMVTGHHIGDHQDAIFCRNGDAYPFTEVLGRGVLLRNPQGQAGDKHWVLLRIPSLKEGCLQVEAQRGTWVSVPHSLLVLEDEEAVGEVRQLEAPDCGTANVSELLQRLGAVLRFERDLRQAGGRHAFDSDLLSRMARTAQELAATCMLRNWGALLRLVLPVAGANGSMAEAVAGIEQHLAGMPLLHAAVMMGGAKVVTALGAWAASTGYSLRLDTRWGGGLTPLHVVALLRKPEAVAVALTGLFPHSAPALWAAAVADHGEETPLGLACRLNKRGLLGALAGHGVPAAGAMLAALELQDASASVPRAQRLPAGLEDSAGELDHQRREWTKLYGKELFAKDSAVQAGQPSRSWPCGGGTKKCDIAGSSEPAEPALNGLRPGHESPSSVLSPLGAQRALCSAPASLQPCGAPHAVSNTLDGAQAALQGREEQQPSPAAPSAAAASFYLPFKAQQEVGAPAAELSHAESSQGGAGKGKGLQAAEAGKGLSLVRSFEDSPTERRFRRWHAGKLSKMDSVVFAVMALLFCTILSAAPAAMRQQMHLWLLSTVARAPLMLQPLLLLCQPARNAYRRCRDSMLAVLHIAMFGLQYWAVKSRGTDWLTGNQVLASYPAGLWLLVAVFTLQMRFALQVPALLAMYAANVLLLPTACMRSMAAGAVHSVPACVAVSGVRMFAVVVVLPLLSAWLLEARARTIFLAAHGQGGSEAAA